MNEADGLPTLRILVQTEWGQHHYDLAKGGELIFGRGPQAQVPVPRASVSQEHLRLSFDGREVTVQDLNSANGTQRLPQEAPFQSAKFPLRCDELRLRLSKADITLSWFPLDAHETQAVAATALMGATALSELPGPRRSHDEKTEVMAPTAHAAQADAPKAAPEKRSAPAPTALPHRWARRVPLPVSLGLGLGAVAGVSIAGWLNFLGPLFQRDPVLMHAGGGLDLAAEWLRGLLLLLPIILPFVLVGLALLLRKGKDWEPLLRRRIYACALLLLVVALAWPAVRASWAGAGLSRWPALLRLRAIQSRWDAKRITVENVNDELNELKSLLEELSGSSQYFVTYMQLERLRVLNTCGGVGDKEWKYKKICLQKLASGSVEAITQIRPALLMDVAARAVLLLNLDGITRVIASDGLEDASITGFLDLLSLATLDGERREIAEVLESKDLSDTTKRLRSLELRRAVELRMEVKQIALRLPSHLRLRVPGPLESGI